MSPKRIGARVSFRLHNIPFYLKKYKFFVALFLAYLFSGMIFFNHGHLVFRRIAQTIVTWIPLLALFYFRTIWTNWKKTAVFIVSSAVSLAALGVLAPKLFNDGMRVSYFNLDVDHRIRPFEDGRNEDGVYCSTYQGRENTDPFNIIFLGDSFVYGYCTKPTEALPAIVGRKIHEHYRGMTVMSANFGWVSSGPVLQNRQLREIGGKYKPNLIIQLLDMTDFWDDVSANYRLQNVATMDASQFSIFRAMTLRYCHLLGFPDFWIWPKRDVPRDPLLSFWKVLPLKRYFPLWQPLKDSEPYLNFTWDAILRANLFAGELGARYVLFVIPRYQHYNRSESPRDKDRSLIPATNEFIFEPLKYFEEKANSVPFPIHSLLEEFKKARPVATTFADNFHWNAAGTRIASNAVYEFLEQDGFLDRAKGGDGIKQ